MAKVMFGKKLKELDLINRDLRDKIRALENYKEKADKEIDRLDQTVRSLQRPWNRILASLPPNSNIEQIKEAGQDMLDRSVNRAQEAEAKVSGLELQLAQAVTLGSKLVDQVSELRDQLKVKVVK